MNRELQRRKVNPRIPLESAGNREWMEQKEHKYCSLAFNAQAQLAMKHTMLRIQILTAMKM